jgi:hypothetical protein
MCAALWCAVQWCAVLCCAVLCCAVAAIAGRLAVLCLQTAAPHCHLGKGKRTASSAAGSNSQHCLRSSGPHRAFEAAYCIIDVGVA